MYHNDAKALSDFSYSYEKFDKAISDLALPVFASNLEGAQTLEQFNKVYNQITDSYKDSTADSDRLSLAKEAISLNNQLLDYLNNTNDLEGKTKDALDELNTKATVRLSSLIKNDAKLMNKALEIADASTKELNNLSTYKSAIMDKMIITNKLLQNIVDDNGGLKGFIKFLKDNLAKIQSQEADLDNLSKQFSDLDNNRKNAFAYYKKLAEE